VDSIRPLVPPSQGFEANSWPLRIPPNLRFACSACLDVPRRFARSQAPLLVAIVASFSVHGLPFVGLGVLANSMVARAAVPLPPLEVEIEIPPPAPEPPQPELPEPKPAVAMPPPKPVRQKVREEKKPEPVEQKVEEQPSKPDPEPPAPAQAPAGPTVPAEQATTTGCQTGVCLPVGTGAGGPGRIGATGSGQGGTGTGQGTRPPAFTNKEPAPLYRVQPSYPEEAAERELEGWVLVRFSIKKDGTVSAPEIVKSSSRLFDRAALDAIRSWKYAPQMLDGQAVERGGVLVKLNFKFED